MKIADFGLSKRHSFLIRKKSNSIVSLWYRAPEIIFGATDYFIGVDMWSIGCIMGDFLLMKPLFAL
ncbi:MAG: protein kinase domain-containing protein [Candidatus Roizmanbacteria bacterium]